MAYQLEKLPKNSVKITVTLTPAEQEPFLKKAAVKLSQEVKIDGFRPGTAPFDIVKKKVGDMALIQSALEAIVHQTLWEAVEKEEVKSIGNPEINVEKAAPGNDLVYTATFALMPEIKKLVDLKKQSFPKKETKVENKQIQDTVKELQKMQVKETQVDRAATNKDKVVVDMTMSKDKVVIEGGIAKDHTILMTEDYYVPGLKEELVGLKAGDEKKFSLPFPKDHFQKMLAGSTVDYEVKVKSVHELSFPEVNDDFAKSVGQENMEKLNALIKENLTQEMTEKNQVEQEREILEALANATEYGDIPDLLIKNETQKMLAELQQEVQNRGMNFMQYLADLKKKPDEIREDFKPQAEMRIKVALLLERLAKDQGIKVEEKELDEAIDKVAEEYKNNDKIREYIFSPEYRERETVVLKNRKTIDWLIKELVKA